MYCVIITIFRFDWFLMLLLYVSYSFITSLSGCATQKLPWHKIVSFFFFCIWNLQIAVLKREGCTTLCTVNFVTNAVATVQASYYWPSLENRAREHEFRNWHVSKFKRFGVLITFYDNKFCWDNLTLFYI